MRKKICICIILIFLLVNGYSQAIQDQSLNPKEDPEINALLEDIPILSKPSDMPKKI